MQRHAPGDPEKPARQQADIRTRIGKVIVEMIDLQVLQPLREGDRLHEVKDRPQQGAGTRHSVTKRQSKSRYVGPGRRDCMKQMGPRIVTRHSTGNR